MRVDPNPGIGRVLRAHREAKGISREELAHQAGVSFWTVIKIETGDRGIGTKVLGKVGKILGKDFEHEMLGVLSAD